MQLIRIQHAEPLEGYMVRLRFNNGVCRDVNVEPYLRGPIFQPVRDDPALFRALRVDGGSIVWPNGADIDPDVLYHQLTPAWAVSEAAPAP